MVDGSVGGSPITPPRSWKVQRHRVDLRQPRGSAPKAAGIAMAFKLIDAAQERWRAVNATQPRRLFRAEGRFECGKLVERDRTRSHPGRRRHPCSVAW